MIDAILYVPDFPALADYLAANHPELLEHDDAGNVANPPLVIGFSRTPAVVSGDSLMVYARLRDDEAGKWRDMEGVEVLAQAEYTGDGHATADLVYESLFSDPAAKSKYESVHNTDPYEVGDGEGGTVTMKPPKRFGAMA